MKIPSARTRGRRQVPRCLILLLGGLAACTPYPYAPEVTRFSASLAAIGRSVEEGPRALEADRASLGRARGGFAGAPLSRGRGCGAREQTSPPCRVVVAAGPAVVSQAITLTPAYREPLAALDEYAQSLAALANAADRQALDAASADVAKSLGTMAGLAGAAVPGVAAVPVVATALLSVVGQALDYERFLRLRQAVRDGHPLVVALSTDIAAVIGSFRAARLVTIGDTLDAVLAGMPRQAGSANRLAGYDLATERAAAINAVGQVDPVAIQRDLVAAHAALRDALDDPGRGFANARTVVESFARQAATWRASLPTSNTP